MRLSVVVPARNEEAVIAATIREIVATLEAAAIPHEVVLVNDNSTRRDGGDRPAAGSRTADGARAPPPATGRFRPGRARRARPGHRGLCRDRDGRCLG
ncbi:MAG: hypothetical protein KatS3mg061_1373 [Dehalococcoidia bacterium]|nr:MAG: hypothetical protein KatS3mg061_1373 [Dehalococcoidia bacterium]